MGPGVGCGGSGGGEGTGSGGGPGGGPGTGPGAGPGSGPPGPGDGVGFGGTGSSGCVGSAAEVGSVCRATVSSKADETVATSYAGRVPDRPLPTHGYGAEWEKITDAITAYSILSVMDYAWIALIGVIR